MKTTSNLASTCDSGATLQDLFYRCGAQEVVPRASEILINPEIEPMPHQLGNLNNAMTHKAWGFFDDAGTGKTFPAQAFALYSALYGEKVLVLMPPVLLSQFRRSLFSTFIGSENLVKVHTLTQDGYPRKLSKKVVQEIRRKSYYGLPQDYPPPIVQQADKLEKARDLEFTPAEVKYIKESRGSESLDSLCARFGCSKSTLSKLRGGTVFREDLFAKWSETGSWPDIMLCSYQMFVICKDALRTRYSVVIADEVHSYLSHPSSKTHKYLKGMLFGQDRDTRFVPMTGTPIQNCLTDTYGIIKLLNPHAYPDLQTFKVLHEISENFTDSSGRGYTVVTGYKNKDLLRSRLFANASRVTKEEVLSLDRPQIIEREVELSDEHLALYKKLVRERVLEVNGQTISAVQAQSLRQKVLQMASYPDPFSDRPIAEIGLRTMIEEILNEVGCKDTEKVVIFAIYNNTISAMAEWFEDLNPALVYGKSDTDKGVEKFLNDPTCRVMLAHYQSGGVGLNLQGVCRTVICAEPTSVPGQFTQATDRVYRKGQDKVVTFYLLKIVKTAWKKQMDAMLGKMQLSREITLDKSQLLSELLGED